MTLAYAPGAVVVHQRRATIGAYLRQQRGYGYAEGLLFRKYPYHSQEGVYRESGWFAHWFGGAPRIYYGAFGRGLFQTIYPGITLPMAAELPLTFQWVGIAIFFAAAGCLSLVGSFQPIFGLLGILGLFTTILCACAGATTADSRGRGFSRRAILALLWLLGSLVRSWERERVKLSSHLDTSGAVTPAPRALSGTIFCTNASTEFAETIENQPMSAGADVEAMAGALHAVLVRRGLAVKKGTTFDPFDLQIILAPWIRVAVLFLNRDGALSVAWRTRLAWGRVAGTLIGTLFLFLLGGSSFFHSFAAVAVVSGLTTIFTFAIMNARRVPAVIGAASAELSTQCGWFGPASREGKSTGEIPG